MKFFLSSLLVNNRFYILLFSLVLSIGIYFFFSPEVITETQTIIKIQQTYGLTSVFFLYIALLIGPFSFTFKNFPWNKQLSHARRAIGVGAFYFASLHAYLSLFKQLGGLEGLGFLDNKYLTVILLGFGGLIILFALTITSLDWAIRKMHFKNWKLLHRFVYLASIAILIHALMLGTHYGDLSGVVAQITFFAIAFLLLLEAPRIENWLTKAAVPRFGWASMITLVLLSICYFTLFSPINKGNFSFDIHATHKQLAQEANNMSSSNTLPGLTGDRNLRYTVSLDKPEIISAGQDTQLTYKVYDATNGTPVTLFKTFYEKPIHMIVVDNSLTYFNHIHPTFQNESFSITTRFPEKGIYRTYLQYQPWNAIEQQVAFAFPVGTQINHSRSSHSLDTKFTKTFGNYEVSLSTETPLNAEAMTFGKQTLTITIKDARTKKPIKNLKPYLGAFGHMSMIKQDTYDFIHIHPANLIPPQANQTAGPLVEFLPVGIYGKFKPGIYRMFVELNPNGKILVADFTVKVN